MGTPGVLNEEFTLSELESRMNVFQIPEIDDDLVNPTFQEFTDIKQRAIRKFMVSYDTTYLKRNNFTQAELNLLKQKLWKNKVLIKLINNFLVPSAMRAYTKKYIEGPISLTIYQGKVSDNNDTLYMTIYIYGELHRDTRGHCDRTLLNRSLNPTATQQNRNDYSDRTNRIRFGDFITQLSIQTPTFFDLFIETSINRRDNNVTSTVFGHNFGFFYFSLYLCFQEIAYWTNHFFPTAFNYYGNRQIDLNLINANLPPGVPPFVHLNQFVNILGNKRLDNNMLTPSVEPKFIQSAKNIIINTGGIIRLPPADTPEWTNFVFPELINLGLTPVRNNSFEMMEIKENFRECFRLETRKTNTRRGFFTNFEKCRLGRFHDIDARRLGIEDARLNVLELGYGITLEYFIWKPPHFYDLSQTLFVGALRDIYRMVSLENFLNYIRQPIHEQNLIALGGNPAIHRFATQAYGILEFCFTQFPPLQKLKRNCDPVYRNEIILFILDKLVTRVPSDETILGRPLVDIFIVFENILVALNGQTNTVIIDDNTALLYLSMLSAYFFKVYVLVMDLYCLLRVFKKYKIKTDCQPNRNYNLIIYAGDAHSETYRDFMDYHGRIQTRRLTDIEGVKEPDIERAIGQRTFVKVYENRNEMIPIESCVTLDLSGDTRIRPLRRFEETPITLGLYQ